MSAPDSKRYKKGTWVVGAVLVTCAVSGFFMGLQQTGSTLNMSEPVSVITADSVRRASLQTNDAPVAVSYRDQNWLRDGPNAHWENRLAKLVQPAPDRSSLTNITEADREQARGERADRRAYDGAPPVVPHPIVQDASTACMACHGEGLAVKESVAPKISHPHFRNCTQCHVPSVGPGFRADQASLTTPPAANEFAGTTATPRGSRAWSGAPPTIPHPTHMRSDCLSCHGPTGPLGLRTTHPERHSCLQCHVPDADLDQRRFIKTTPHADTRLIRWMSTRIGAAPMEANLP